MAKINRIVRRPQISNFQQGRPTGAAAGFDVIAAGLEALDQRLTPVAAQQLKESGEAAGREEARGSLGEMVINNPRAVITGGDGDTALAGGEFISYANAGAVRNKPISDRLKSSLGFLSDLGVTMEVFSGGQPAQGSGQPRVGSTRHDHGESADVFFYKEGRKLDWQNEDDVPVFQEIVRRARENGVTGFGAGPGYMQPGSMHIGFGAPAVWGAGGKGENAPEWLRSAFSGAQGQSSPTVSTSGSTGDTPRPTVTVRTREGNLEARMYSPFSGPLLQVHNQAAMAAYQAEVYVKAGKDMMDLSFEFEGQPQDFQDAAQQYVDQIVSNAPDMIKGAIREGLEQDAFKISAGMMEAQQRETRQRASNASAALVDRWSTEYADALASGTDEEIASTRAKLDSVLRTREALPGIAWTPEQSANVFWKAERTAQTTRATLQKKAIADTKSDLDIIRKSAMEGRVAEAEASIDWEASSVLAPEETREALAHVRLRDNMPDILQMTPGEMLASISEMSEQPVMEEWQLDMVDAAKDIQKEQARAFREDPIGRADQVLDRKPPAIPDLDPANPDKFIKAMAASAEYGQWLFERGYTQKPVYFSKADTERLSLAMSKEQLPEARAAIAGAIVAGFGNQAVAALDEIGGDSLTLYAGKMLASGAPGALSAEILRGQSLIDNKSVEFKAQLSFEQAINDNFGTAFQSMPALPGGRMPQNEVAEAAQAIYASRTYGKTLSDTDAKAAMTDAINAALGQTKNKAGDTTGGIQPVAGVPTLLPMGVSGEEADLALSRAMGGTARAGEDLPGPMGVIARAGNALAGVRQSVNADIWQEAAGGVPYGASQPLSAEWFRTGQAQIVPTGGNMYRISIAGAAGSYDALDANGNVFEFDIKKLIEAAQ